MRRGGERGERGGGGVRRRRRERRRTKRENRCLDMMYTCAEEEEENEDVVGVRERTMKWLHSVVVGFDLCPFAKSALPRTRCVCVSPSTCEKTEELLHVLEAEARLLVESYEEFGGRGRIGDKDKAGPSPSLDGGGVQTRGGAAATAAAPAGNTKAPVTTLLVIPGAILAEFNDFMDFISLGERLLEETPGLASTLQLVPFHPHASFSFDVAAARAKGDTDAHLRTDPADYTARSPYPTIHLLLEDDVAAHLEHWRTLGLCPQRDITERNQTFLRGMGRTELQHQFVDALFLPDDSHHDPTPTTTTTTM